MVSKSPGTAIRTVGARWLVVVFLLGLPVFGHASAAGDVQGENIYVKWEEVSSLRATGQFERAIEVLKGIIKEYSNTDQVLRLAYNNLVYTYYVANDPTSEEAAAREALERFPNLRADDVQFPPVINEEYERLRREMFGSLVISRPEGARVILDEDYKGNTPITLPLVRVGSHPLVVSKSGYNDYTETLEIEPNVVRQMEVSLERQKDRWWWLTRVGAPVAALATGIAVALIGGGDEGAAAAASEPLPPPPPPPGQ